MLNVFITDLAAYNAGYLIGEWITLPCDADELKQTVDAILKQGTEACGSEGHEEYFITDWEWNDHEFMSVGEYSSVYQLNEQLEPWRINRITNSKRLHSYFPRVSLRIWMRQ